MTAAEGEGSAVDRATQRLRVLIMQGRFVGGQPLIEADLVRQLAVARSTVRECIRQLETQGLLVARARGLQLRRLSRGDVDDLFALRELLEVYAAGRAAKRFPLVSRAERQAIARELRYWRSSAADDIGAFSDRNRELHDRIVALAGNVHLPRMLDHTLLVLFTSQFRPWLSARTLRPAIDDHVRVLEAIGREDARAAGAAMRRHIQEARRVLGKLPDDAFAAD